MTRMKSAGAGGAGRRWRPQAPRRKPTPQARDLVEKSLEIARLEAQIRREHQAYQERPEAQVRRRARLRSTASPQYVDNWRLKIERIGNLNYPEEAKATRRSTARCSSRWRSRPTARWSRWRSTARSGSKVLDQAAIRIVRLAAPFERFPDNIRADTDILHITRTWTFTRGDQVVAE